MAELYPEGRTLFFEGDDVDGFVATCHALHFEVTVSVTVEVPAEKLDAFMALAQINRWPLGS
jgi:hypothetical protein